MPIRPPDASEVDALADALRGRRWVALTGAGLSTDSGIPDYRGPDSRPTNPIAYRDFVGRDDARRRYWFRSMMGFRSFGAASPNAGHQALAALGVPVVTQNVDGLHQAAGARTVVDLHGAKVRHFLRHLFANSVDKLKVSGKALYSCMLNEQGGVIDDLIVYFLAEDFFRVVVNAATHDKDLAWIEKQAKAFDVKVIERKDLAMIAVQGWLEKSALKSKLVLQVHDELLLEVPDNELMEIRTHLPRLMAQVAELKVPLVVEVGVGPNWEAAH